MLLYSNYIFFKNISRLLFPPHSLRHIWPTLPSLQSHEYRSRCNARLEMTLIPAASCSPELFSPAPSWAGNIIFVSIRDASYVQSVMGTLFPLQRCLKVGTGSGCWVRLLAWVCAGWWGVKDDVFGLSPHADSTWFSSADPMTWPGFQAAVLASGSFCEGPTFTAYCSCRSVHS